jgi:hypothetical protein
LVLPAQLDCGILSQLTPAKPHMPAKGMGHWAISPVHRLTLNDVGPKVSTRRTEILELGLIAFEAFVTASLRHNRLDFLFLTCCQFHTLLLLH